MTGLWTGTLGTAAGRGYCRGEGVSDLSTVTGLGEMVRD